MVYFSLFRTPIGACGIAWRRGIVVATQLPEKTPAATAARLASRANATEASPPPEIQSVISSMTALLEGAHADLSQVRCDLDQVDPFAAKVYVSTRAIPPGETRTYGSIAAKLGNERLARHVGRALGRNPLPIVVPCHRVVGANQKLTGFSAYGGVDTKLKMLRIEGAQLGETLQLFSDGPGSSR